MTGSYKLALYSDNAGAPGSLLASSITVINPPNGLLSIGASGVSLVAGTRVPAGDD